MKCRNCGTEIADKALICYKCGIATTDAKYQAVPLRPKRRIGPAPIVIALLIALLLIAAMYYFRVIG